MCVIVHVKAKQTVAKNILQNCYDHNNQGWGIMWAERGKINTVKDVASFEDFYKEWKEVPRHCERAIHFRIRTGVCPINKDNCHPFQPAEDIGLMHNGIIQTPMIENNMSDTYNFCKYELAPLIEDWPNFMQSEEFKKLMEVSEVTGYSKLLFMNSRGSTLRIRDNLWHKHDGVYFSNAHSIQKSHYVSSKYTNSYGTCGYTGSSSLAAIKGRVSTNDTKFSSVSGYSYADSDWDYYDREYPVLVGESAVIDETTIKCDLYSGNKTDAEGQEYIARLEEEKEVGDEVDPFPDTSEELMEEEGGSPELYFDIEQLLAMSYEDLLDAVQDYPKSMAYTVKGLLDTCASAGILKLSITQEGVDVLRKEAVI